MDSAQSVSEVSQLIADYGEAARSGDADRYAALFDDAVVWCMPGAPPVVGREGVKAAITRTFAARTGPSDFSIDPEHIDVVGDIATVVAHAQSTRPNASDLSALFVLRRVRSQWLIWRQTVTRR